MATARRFTLATALAALLAAPLAAQAPGPTVPVLTPLQSLQAQVVMLRQQLLEMATREAQCRADRADTAARLDSVTLTQQGQALQADRQALEALLLKQLGAGPGDTLDWGTSPPTLRRKGGTR